MARYFMLANVTREYASARMKSLDEDRIPVIKKLCESLGVTFHSMDFTRGIYDIIGIVDAPDFETINALKCVVVEGGVISQMDILEAIDIDVILRKAAEATGSYSKPGE